MASFKTPQTTNGHHLRSDEPPKWTSAGADLGELHIKLPHSRSSSFSTKELSSNKLASRKSWTFNDFQLKLNSNDSRDSKSDFEWMDLDGTRSSVISIDMFKPSIQDHKARLDNSTGMKEKEQPEDYGATRSRAWNCLFIATVVSGQLITQGQFGSAVIGPNLAIAKWLGTSVPGEAAWMPASYGMTLGVFVLLWGAVGDAYGSKKIVILGYIITAVANVWSGFSYSPIHFDIFRALSGIGGAAIIPNAAGLLGRAYPPGRMRMISFSVLGALAPTGALLGGVVGSWMVETVGPRWIYFLTSIISVMLVCLGAIVIPADVKKDSPPIDYFGFALGGAGLILFNFAWNQGPLVGWTTPYVYALMTVGLVLIVAFFFWEKRLGSRALVPPTIFTKESSLVPLSLWFGWMSFGTFLLYTATFLREIRGYSHPLSVAAQMAPLAPGGIAAALLVIWLFPRLAGHYILSIAMAAFCAGNLLMSLAPRNQTYWAQVFPAVSIVVLGPDLSYASASLIIANAVPHELQGCAAGLVATIVNYSLSIGLGMSSTVERYVADGDVLRGYRGAFYFATCISFVGCLIVVLFVRTSGGPGGH